MRWEYKRVNLDILDVPQAAFEVELNRLGAEGWELVSTLQHARHGYSHEIHLVFKRALDRVDDAVAAE
jgi:hypothetical protein